MRPCRPPTRLSAPLPPLSEKPRDTFTIIGPARGNGGFYTSGDYQIFLHTSCSAPVGPGTIAGGFLVLDGASEDGGNLCPM